MVDKIINTMITFQLQLKVLHWQTKSYAQHIAFGGAYDYMTDAIDKFVEVYQGKYGRIPFNTSYKVVDMDAVSPERMCREFTKFLISITDMLKPKEDSDLLNMRDDMLSEINKLKYLLTLK